MVLGLDPIKEREYFEEYKLTFQPNGYSPATSEKMFENLEQLVRSTQEPVALFVDFASRLLLRPDLPTECEHRCFTRALVLSQTVQPRPVGQNGHVECRVTAPDSNHFGHESAKQLDVWNQGSQVLSC